jgi:hypothetical protein
MRFSSLLRSHAAPRAAARPDRGPHVPPAAQVETPPPVLPRPVIAEAPSDDDLDQRVRLIGEWQLGEA